ncbi:MAG: hypothetical protein JEZ07_10240 [Phycisphaerae bacterium]|nr:hypothetical protein [Phycisphaerae bacterium]
MNENFRKLRKKLRQKRQSNSPKLQLETLESRTLLMAGGPGTVLGNAWLVQSYADLKAIGTGGYDLDECYKLDADINASASISENGSLGFGPIAADTDSVTGGFQGTEFTGIFDGQGHVISGLQINRPTEDFVGLFGSVNNATIQNIRIEASSVNGDSNVGSFIGASSNNSIFANLATTAIVSGNSNTGGIIGTLFDSTLDNSFAAGIINGDNAVIGSLGGTATADNCFYDSDTTGTADGNATGKTTAQMRTKSTFTGAGWDFGSDWSINQGNTYPYLQGADQNLMAAPGECINFNGSNEYITVGDTNTNIKTIEFWIYPQNLNDGILNLNAGQQIYIAGDAIDASDLTAPTVYVNGVSTTALTRNTWQHVAITTDTDVDLSNFDIGRAVTNEFGGYLDEVRVWTNARTQDQIRENMANYAAPASANLGGYWRFDEGTGTTAYDLTGNGHHGSFVNMGDTDRIAATTSFSVWEGDVSTNPATAGNWSMGSVPNSSISVCIAASDSTPALTGGFAVEDLIIQTGANFNGNGQTLQIKNNAYNFSTFTHGNGTVDYISSNDQIVMAADYYNLTFSNAGTNTLNGDIGIANALTISGGSFAHNNKIVDYNASGNQNITNTTYYDLTVSGSGTKTYTAGIIGNDLAINDAVTFDANAALTTGNDLIFDSTGRLLVGQTLTIGNALTAGNGTIEFDKAGDQNINNLSYKNLAIGGSGNKTLSADLTLNGTFSITNGSTAILIDGGADRIVDFQQAVNTNGGDGGVNFTGANSSITYSRSGSQDIIDGTYNHFVITGTGTSGTPITKLWQGGTTNINGNFTLGGAYNTVLEDAVICTINFNDAVDDASDTSGFGFATSGTTVTYAYTGDEDIIDGTYRQLTINSTGNKTWAPGMSYTKETFNLSNATIIDNGSTSDLYLQGDVNYISGSINYTNATSTVFYDRDGTQDIIPGVYTELFIVGNNTKTLQGNVTVNNKLEGSEAGSTISDNSVARTFTINGVVSGYSGSYKDNTAFDMQASIVEYNDPADGSFILGGQYKDIALGGNSYKYLHNAVVVAGDISIGGTETFDYYANPASVEYEKAGNQSIVEGTYGSLILSASGNKTLSGDVIIRDGSITVNGTAAFVHNNKNVEYYGYTNTNTQTVTDLTYYDLTLSTRSGSYASTKNIAAFTIENDLVINEITTVNADMALAVGNDLTFTGAAGGNLVIDDTFSIGGTFTAGSGTVTYNKAGDQAINDWAYNNLTTAVSGTKTYTAGAIARDLTINASSIFDANAGLSVGRNINFQNNSGYLLIGESLAVTGSVDTAAGTINYDKNGAQNIAALDYHNLTLSTAGVKTAAGDIGIAGALTIIPTASFGHNNQTVAYNDADDQNIINATYHNLTVSGGDTKTYTGGTIVNNITIEDDTTLDANAALTAVNIIFAANNTANADGTLLVGETLDATTLTKGIGTVHYDKANVQTIDNLDYYNLELSGNAVKTYTAGTIANDLIINGSTTLDANAALSVGNDLTFSANGTALINDSLAIAGTFNTGTGTINYDKNGAQNIAALSYYNITISTAGNKTLAGDIAVAGSFGTGGTANFVHDGNSVDYNKAGDQTIASLTYNDLIVSGSGTKTYNTGAIENDLIIQDSCIFDATGNLTIGNDLTFTDDGELQFAGNLSVGNGLTSGTGTIYYVQNNDQLIADLNYYNIVLDGSGNKTLANDITVSGAMTIGGTATLVHNNKSVTYDGTAQTITDAAYYDLIVSNGNTKTFNAGDITHDLIIEGATIFDANSDLDVNNLTFTANGTLLAGAGLNISNTFTKGSGTVNYDQNGDQTIQQGDYYNLTLSTAGVKTAEGSISTENIFTISAGSFAHNNKQFTYNGPANRDVTATTYYDLILSGGEKDMPAGNVTVANNFNANSQTVDMTANGTLILSGTTTNFTSLTTGTGTIQYNKNGNQNIAALTYYDLDLSGGGTKTLAGDTTVNNVLTTDVGVSLDGSSRSLTINESWTNNGTFTANTSTVDYNKNGNQDIVDVTYYNLDLSTGGTKTLAGNIAVQNALTTDPGVTLAASDKTMMLAGTWSNNGTFAADTSTVDYNKNGNQNIVGISYYNLDLSTGGTKTLANNVTVENILTNDAAVTLDSSNKTLTIGDVWTNNGTFTANAGTVLYNKNGNQNVAAVNYNNLTLSTAGNKTLAGNIGIADTLTINAPAVLVHNSKAVSYNGSSDQDITAAAYYDLNLSGSNTKSHVAGTSIANNLSIANNTVFTANAALEVGNTLTISGASSQMDLNSQTLTLNGTANLTGSVTGDGVITYANNASHDGSKFSGTYDMLIDGAYTVSLAADSTIDTLTINNAGGDLALNSKVVTFESGPSLTGDVSGNGTVIYATTAVHEPGKFSGIYNLTVDGANTVTLAGNTIIETLTVNNAAGKLAINDKAIILNSPPSLTGTVIDDGTIIYSTTTSHNPGKFTGAYNLTVNGNETVTLADDTSVNTLTINNANGRVALNDNALTLNAAPAITGAVSGDGTVIYSITATHDPGKFTGIYSLTVDGANTVTLGALTSVDLLTINHINGRLDAAADIKMAQTPTLTGRIINASDIYYTGDANHDHSQIDGSYNLYAQNAATVTLVNDADIVSLTATDAGTSIDIDTYSLTVNDTINLGDGILTGTGTLHYISENDLDGTNITGEINLSIEPAGDKTVTLSGPLDIADLVIATGDTLDADGYDINLSGDWSNNGTFVHGNNTVTFDGNNQSINASNTFYNFNKTTDVADVLTFEAGQTQTIENTLTLTGATGQTLSLHSSIDNTQWQIDPQGTFNHGNLNIKDSNNISGADIYVREEEYLDEGNNTNWVFNAIPTSGNSNVTTFEEQSYTIKADDLVFADENSFDSLTQIKITAISASGNLKLNNINLDIDDEVTIDQINNSQFVFVPHENANGYGINAFSYLVHDNTEYSVETGLVEIDIIPVNDAPSFTPGDDIDIFEDNGPFSLMWASNIDKGAPNEILQNINLSISTDNIYLFDVMPAIDENGVITFTPTANIYGSATLTVSISDDGGTANGGINIGNTETLRLNIGSVNDGPVSVNPENISTIEDIPVAITPFTVYDVDAYDDPIRITLEVANGTLNFSTMLAPIVDINAALAGLTYTPNSEFHGIDTMLIWLDDLAYSSGSPLTGVFTTSIIVAEVNDPPEIIINAMPIDPNQPAGNGLIVGQPVSNTDGQISYEIPTIDIDSNDVDINFYLDIDKDGIITETDIELTSQQIDDTYTINIVDAVMTDDVIDYGWHDVYLIPVDEQGQEGDSIQTTILVPNRMECTRRNPITYIDSNNNPVTIKVNGNNTLEVLLPGDIDEGIDCYSIFTNDAEKASITIKGKDRKEIINFGSIDINGDFRKINAPMLNVNGSITIDSETLKSIKIDSFNGLDIGPTIKPVKIKAKGLEDAQINIEGTVTLYATNFINCTITADNIKSMKADRIDNTTIKSPFIKKIDVKYGISNSTILAGTEAIPANNAGFADISYIGKISSKNKEMISFNNTIAAKNIDKLLINLPANSTMTGQIYCDFMKSFSLKALDTKISHKNLDAIEILNDFDELLLNIL